MKKIPPKTVVSRTSSKGTKREFVTKSELVPYFESIKDLIVSTAKGTETRLTKRMDAMRDDIGTLQIAVSEHSQMIKELKTDMKSMEGRLTEKIDSVHTRVDDHDIRIGVLEKRGAA